MSELKRLLEAAKKYDEEGVENRCRCRVELSSCATASLTSGEDAASPLAGQHNREGGSVDRCSTSTFNLNLLSGPVLPTISAMYERGSWRVAHGLSKIFKAANITTSVKLEGRRHKTPEATFHSLRHTFVSFAANAGVPLHVVQSIVGHESTAMTRHYYHENIAALQSAVAAIPTL